MEIDSNSCGSTQWFYFGISNTKPKKTYKFNILNFKKQHSQFQEGMQLWVYSEINSRKTKDDNDWRRGGKSICYHPTDCYTRIDISFFEKCEGKYTLEFEYTPEYKNDLVYFAYSVPYTDQNLRSDIKLWSKQVKPQKKYILSKELLCFT
jgi:hypothetical protein